MSEEAIEGDVVNPDVAALVLDEHSGAHLMPMTDAERSVIYGKKDGTELSEDDAYRRILDQIFSAETPDAVLTPIEAKNIGEYVGVPLLLFGFELIKSEYEVGTPFYAALQCRDVEKNEPVVLSSGHRKVLAQCVRLRQLVKQQKGNWPFQVMPTQRGTGAGGDPLYELGKWPEDYVPNEGPPF